MKKAGICIFIIVLTFLGVHNAKASKLDFIFEGKGSGYIDGVEFDKAFFKIILYADTVNILKTRFGYTTGHVKAEIYIERFGYYKINHKTFCFLNTKKSSLGFSTEKTGDLLCIRDPHFEQYHLDSFIEPVESKAPRRPIVRKFKDIKTDYGKLTMTKIDEIVFYVNE